MPFLFLANGKAYAVVRFWPSCPLMIDCCHQQGVNEMSVEAVKFSHPESCPWLENGEVSRERVRKYILAERADLDASLLAGQDVNDIIARHQTMIDGYLSGWSDQDRLSFLTIYSQECTASIEHVTTETAARTEKMVGQQKSMRAGAYGMVFAFAVILVIIYISTGR